MADRGGQSGRKTRLALQSVTLSYSGSVIAAAISF
jgi:hypothetical protein